MTEGPGDLVGTKYRLVRQLGDGAMGVVYEAIHERLNTKVAVKLLHPDLVQRPGLAARFVKEAQVAASIRSPHVAQVWDADVTDRGVPFLVMELLSGESLRQLLDREGRLSPGKAVDVAVQVLLGLESAHALGVVHRDLKPENVFLASERGNSFVKLIDFGIAKLKRASKFTAGLTENGMILGTPEYMAPEQLKEAQSVDARADIYSVGCMLYEMLSGKGPIEGPSLQATLAAVEQGMIRSLSELCPWVTPGLSQVTMQALCKDRENRYPTASAFRQALSQYSSAAANAASGAVTVLPSKDLVLPTSGQRPSETGAMTPYKWQEPAQIVGKTVEVAPEEIEREIARASTLDAPRALPASQSIGNYSSAPPPFDPSGFPGPRSRDAQGGGVVVYSDARGYAASPGGHRPQSNAVIYWLSGLAIILGAATAAVFFIGSDIFRRPVPSEPPVPLPTAPSPSMIAPEASSFPSAQPTEPPRATPKAPTATPAAKQRPAKPLPSSGPAPTAVPGPTTTGSNPPPPPLTIPLPSGLPSGFPTSITVPTTLPTSFPTELPLPGLSPRSPPTSDPKANESAPASPPATTPPSQ